MTWTQTITMFVGIWLTAGLAGSALLRFVCATAVKKNLPIGHHLELLRRANVLGTRHWLVFPAICAVFGPVVLVAGVKLFLYLWLFFDYIGDRIPWFRSPEEELTWWHDNGPLLVQRWENHGLSKDA